MIRCHLARSVGAHKLRIAEIARETGLNRNCISFGKLCFLPICQVSDLWEPI